MKISKTVLSLLAFLCIGILPLAVAVRSANVFQSPTPTLFVDPSLVSFDNLIVGQRFSVNISVANVTNLKGYEFKLSFNTQMLDVVGIALLPELNLPVGNWAVNDSAGTVWINSTYEGDAITTVSPVALSHIEFKTMNRGQGPLHLYDTGLVDSSGNTIAHDTADGMVMILRHDVAIIDVVPSADETYTGRLVNVTVTAKNIGDVDENFTVRAYHNNTLFGTSDVTNLGSGSNITIVFTWNTSDVVAGYSYPIKGEATTVPHEANVTNNVLVDGQVKIKIIGDVNGDNIVNLDDWIAYDAAWGTHSGDTNWNPQADINDDGVVDNADGVLIAQNYHNTA